MCPASLAEEETDRNILVDEEMYWGTITQVELDSDTLTEAAMCGVKWTDEGVDWNVLLEEEIHWATLPEKDFDGKILAEKEVWLCI